MIQTGDVLMTKHGKRALVITPDLIYYEDAVTGFERFQERAGVGHTVVDRVPELVRAVGAVVPSGMLGSRDLWCLWGKFALDEKGRLTDRTKAMIMRIPVEVPGHIIYQDHLRKTLYGSLILMEQACTDEETS